MTGFYIPFTLIQAVSAARTPWMTVCSRFCAFFTRISSDDLHPGVTALTLEKHHAPLGSHESFARLIIVLLLSMMCQKCRENGTECSQKVHQLSIRSEITKSFLPRDDGELVGDGKNLLCYDTELLCAVFVQTVVCYDTHKPGDGLAARHKIFCRRHERVFTLLRKRKTKFSFSKENRNLSFLPEWVLYALNIEPCDRAYRPFPSSP